MMGALQLSGLAACQSELPAPREGNTDDVARPDEPATDSSAAAREAGSGVSPAPSEVGSSNWAAVAASFGILTTLAGRGATDVLNEWEPAFEGAPGVEVELARPHIALPDDAGNVYIADKESHAIRKVDLDGVVTTVAGTNQAGDAPDQPGLATQGALSNPNGLWVQPDGQLYIVDLGNAKIRRVSTDGTMTTLIALERLPVGRGLWVAPDESEAYIAAGSELWRWTPREGTVPFATGFSSLGMVVKDAQGRLIAGDRGAHRVYVVDHGGQLTPLIGNGAAAGFVDGALALDTAVNEPRAIWPHDGGFFVGSHDAAQVLYVDDRGFAHLFLDGSTNSHGGDGERWDAPGLKIGEVRSVALSRQGRLIIVENDLGYVRVVQPTALADGLDADP